MSDTYVKKYDVGQIKLDLPYANYIHELPLLSFGDILHTVNLSLVFNYANKTNNMFSLFPGYKLNLQKRFVLNDTNNTHSFYDENGKCISLDKMSDGLYAFQDDSQRILRISTSTNTLPPIPESDIQMEDGIEAMVNYFVEYPNGSKEKYSDNGYLMEVYDKYSDTPFLTYEYYTDWKLKSISYNDKKIHLAYSDDPTDDDITLTYKIGNNNICATTLNAVNDSTLSVGHYSGVNYQLVLSGMNYTAQCTTNDGDGTLTYIKELKEEENNTVTLSDKIGDALVNKISYAFPRTLNNLIVEYANQVDITDKNGVKTRVQYDSKNPTYSYEYIDDSAAMFSANRYLGNISIYHEQNVVAKQKFNDGDCLTYNLNGKWIRSLTGYSNPRGYFLISGWVNSADDEFILTLEERGSDPDETIYCTPGKWTYFAFIFHSESNYLTISFGSNTEAYETRDFKIQYLPDYQEGDWEYAHLYKSEEILNINGANIPLNDTYVRYRKNGVYVNLTNITVDDIIKYKINAKKNINSGEVYENKGKDIVTGVTDLTVFYNDQPIDISAVKVGKRITDKEDKQHMSIIDVDENNPSAPIISNSFVNNVLVSSIQLNTNLDVISATSDNITTSYSYNADGLVTSEGIQGLNTKTVAYSTNVNGDTEITVTDEFNNSTVYTMDSQWGAIKTIRLPDNTVITNTYDGDMSALMLKSFTGNSNTRSNSIEYSNGRVKSLSNGAIDYDFTYTAKGELASVLKNNTGVEHHTYIENDDNTNTVVSQYPLADPALHTTTHIFDKYGRLLKIDNVLENVYDIAPVIDTTKVEEAPSSDNSCAVLSTSADLLRGETTTYIYNTKGELVEKVVANTADADNRISREYFTYDSIGRVETESYYPNTEQFTCISKNIEYEKGENHPAADGTVSKFSYATESFLGLITPMLHKTINEYEDPFHRLTKKTHRIDNATFDKCFSYDKSRIEKVEEHFFGQEFGISEYEYDSLGRISSITANGCITTYTYDEYGQLIREDNQGLDKTFQYVYNGIGNIDYVYAYDYTPKGTEPSGTPVTKTYTYNSTRPDRLTNYNGSVALYNSMGCPTSINGMSATWTNSKLARLSKGTFTTGTETFTYNYNALGQRVSKGYSYTPPTTGLTPIIEGTVTQYGKAYHYDNSGRLLAEATSEVIYGVGNVSRTIKFVYDENGMIGFEYSDDTNVNAYYYQRNLLGDVIAIYDTLGNKVVEYAYDAWGNCTIKGTTTNYVVAHANPIRYRGYYYDEDTNLYYLNARYYSPEWRRFISPADASTLDPHTVNGLNLYSYGKNSPISVSFRTNIGIKNTRTNNNLPSGNLINFTNSNSNSFSYKPLAFSIGLVTPNNSQLPQWMDFSAFYIAGKLGLGYTPKQRLNGLSIASFDTGIIYMKGDIITFDDLNGSIYIGIGALNANASVGLGASASVEVVSAYFGVEFENIVSVDGKAFVGWGFALDFSNGIKIGFGLGVGFEISINFG